jgi:hypothetical protein
LTSVQGFVNLYAELSSFVGGKMALKKRQKNILIALAELGGEATTRQIAKKAGLNVNGVSQSLGALHQCVDCLGGRGGETRWRVKQR